MRPVCRLFFISLFLFLALTNAYGQDFESKKIVPFVPSPRPGPIVHGNSVTLLNQRLYAVYAFARDDVWVVGDTPEVFSEIVRSDYARWEKLIREAHIKAE